MNGGPDGAMGYMARGTQVRDAGQMARVLVVEDETMLALSIESMLEDWGHHVVGSVSTGTEAVRAASELRPDLVLMDVNLSDDLDGISAARQIRAVADIPLIFMTAYSDPEVLSGIAALGSSVLPKPFSASRLRELIAKSR